MKEQNEVIENIEEKTDEVVENVATEVEDTIDDLKEKTVEVPENIEEEGAEVKEEIAEEVEEAESDIASHIKNMKKHDAAKLLVEKAKFIVKDAENQLAECKLLLASDLKDYDKAVQELKANGMDASEELLTQLSYVADEEEVEEDKNVEDIVVFEPREEMAPIYIRDVSSGKFTGFLMSLIGGAVTFAGMAFVASEKLGITVDLSQLSSPLTMQPVYSWYSRLIGLEGDALYGQIFLVLITLFIMWLIYKIRVSTKASANLDHATAQLAAAEEYTVQKGSCKEEMDKVDAYIHDAIKTLKTYQVIFNEQKGKLERILHIEEDQIETASYHHKSRIEMKDTHEMIATIKDFMSVPMSEEGKLSGKSSLFLHRAKSRIQKVLDRLY